MMPKDFQALRQATTFSEVGHIALDIQERYPQPLGQVGGPISTGGLGSLEKNLAQFEKTILALEQEGKHIYNQMPLERAVFRIRQERGAGYKQLDLLEGVYLPLFNSALLKTFYLINCWYSSQGTRWEVKQLVRRHVDIVELPQGYGQDIGCSDKHL